jgi:hypothetical protein
MAGQFSHARKGIPEVLEQINGRIHASRIAENASGGDLAQVLVS